MKILSTMKQLITGKAALVEFALEKVYHKKEPLTGTLYIQANTNLQVTGVTLQAVQLLRISKKETENTILGTKTRRKQFVLPPLKKYELSFDLPVTYPAATKREHKNYKGDLGPLNKATDKAKKKLTSYLLQVKIKLKGKKEELTYAEEIRVEE